MSGVVVVYDDGKGVAETGVTVGSSDISSDIIILKIYIKHYKIYKYQNFVDAIQ